MSLRFLACLSAACLGTAGCATAPSEERLRIVDVPLATTHAEFAFAITTGSRQSAACEENTLCPSQPEREAAMRFALQVERLASAL